MIVFVPKQKPAEAESLLSAQASSVLVWMDVSKRRTLSLVSVIPRQHICVFCRWSILTSLRDFPANLSGLFWNPRVA
jgi:hypothetical protein